VQKQQQQQLKEKDAEITALEQRNSQPAGQPAQQQPDESPAKPGGLQPDDQR